MTIVPYLEHDVYMINAHFHVIMSFPFNAIIPCKRFFQIFVSSGCVQMLKFQKFEGRLFTK